MVGNQIICETEMRRKFMSTSRPRDCHFNCVAAELQPQELKRLIQPVPAIVQHLHHSETDSVALTTLGNTPVRGNSSTMALRRQTRLRKEYIYRKSLHGKEAVIYEDKQRVREALRDGTPLPTELRADEAKLRHEVELEDDETAKLKNSVDDEYAQAGVMDPKVCVTTSRDPSSRLKQFAKELKLVVPNAQRINRGNHKVGELVGACRSSEFTDMIVVQETRGEPDGLIVCHLPLGPTAFFTLSNCVLRHDIADRGTVSEVYPHLIFENFSTGLGQRVADVLKYLFPVPKADSRRVMTFSNEEDVVFFRHHMYENRGAKEVVLHEVGPRFEMQLYQLRLGTLDQVEAENEWVMRPYMNSSKKRRFL